ncbi:MAG: LutB/LldF family L-lactate oxidation iron-sulfur protein [Anaerolineae bacterium]|nr:LutB/LldF family L-lactate oxidation iron-sulfur protein [Anaerolineae bacterium]NUQ04168.1 iron-sulfur cluster-binding protein [Anaerolineae bacterium]
MDLKANQFDHSAVIALEDIQLRKAVGHATNLADSRRRAMMAELPQAQALRQQGRGAKLRALHDLPELLEKMERSVTAAGGHVLWAVDAAEANRHIIDICKRHNLKRGIKSKSMATEEIAMLDALAAEGIEMLESDLGEYIVQVADDHPSHIVMPVMHMSKGQVRDLFIDKLAMPYTDDAGEMTAFIRRHLRQKYIEADFGMSGGNFMIAETGTVVIVTNEGNGRLSTSIPRVHIAVVGIEKIVPTWEDFATLIQLLPRSGTGQRLTVYVNGFTGPARPGEPDGPEEFYLVLVDNGRSDIYAGEYAEALACIRCGACQNVCPVYKQVGGHAYGWVYGGPIGSIVTPLLNGIENAAPLPFASSLCGACKQACPVDIDIPDMLLRLRHDLQSVQDPFWQVSMKAYGFAFSSPLLFELGGKAASLASRAAATLLGGEPGEDLSAEDLNLPYPLGGWTQNRDFPPFAERSFHDWWRDNREGRIS